MADDSAADAGEVLLVQFAREPVAGRVKTRLLPALSPAQACALHGELVLWTCRQLLEADLGEVQVHVAGNPDDPLFRQCRALGARRVCSQSGADLGERMYRALRQGLAAYRKVLLVGSDCPFIDAPYIGAALDALDDAPVVLGPATDGGYVLIGVSRVDRALFEGIPWGTGEVYAATVAALQCLGWRHAELATLSDIDRPQDLPLWESCVSERPPA